MAEDYYSILGVKRDASQAEIQRAYRKLARQYHPDMNPDDKTAKEKFQRVQKAYDVLGSAEKREMYDRYGSSFESMGQGGPGGGWSTHYGPAGGGAGFEEIDFSQLFGGQGPNQFDGSFGDIFRQFTGGRRRQTAGRRGADLEASITIPFNVAIMGGESSLPLQTADGKSKTINVKIPAGIVDGKKIRLRGQGNPGRGDGRPGDLLITVHVTPHPYFVRRGNNLEVSVPVTVSEAARGAKVDVPTPKGTITLTVPPGTSSGKKLRIKGHGVQTTKEGNGDLVAIVMIVLPSTIDEPSSDLLRKFDERQPMNPRADLKW
jgi:DnaJ-class molecular chaperone